MKPLAGTYAVILRSRSRAAVEIGRWGRLDLVPGYYIYVGSAFGPGGVRARVLHHCRRNKRRHWHIDYLREFMRPVSVWCNYDGQRREHRWAAVFSRMTGVSSVPGLGCSDCKCESHLFTASAEPDLAWFSRRAGGAVESMRLQTLPPASVIRSQGRRSGL